jgi:spore coat protein U-like protein
MFNRISARLFRLAVTAAPLAACLLGPAHAFADEAGADLDVSASIEASCVISTSEIAFGAYDAVVANASSPLNGAGTVHVTCTAGSPASVALDQGENASGSRRMTDGSHFLAYSLWQDSGRSQTPWGESDDAMSIEGTGSNQNLTVFAKVAAGQNGAPEGDYSDVVIATVTF